MQPLTWTAHPLRDNPKGKSALLIAIILAVTLAVGVSLQSGLYAFLAFGLLTGAMSRYFLPTRYRLDDRGVAISHLGVRRSYAWALFRRADRHPDGVFLSPFVQPHRLDAFRGQFLRADHCLDEVLYVVRCHIAAEQT